MSHPVVLTDGNFQQQVLEAPELVLVDFGALWCGPCRVMEPVIDQLAKEYGGRLKVGKIDCDTEAQTAARFGIRGMPSFLLFRQGQVVDSLTGAMPKSRLAGRIEVALQAGQPPQRPGSS